MVRPCQPVRSARAGADDRPRHPFRGARAPAEVAGSMVKQVVIELMPLLVDAVRATQGNDPDLRPERDRLS
jgi:hypothetical protein